MAVPYLYRELGPAAWPYSYNFLEVGGASAVSPPVRGGWGPRFRSNIEFRPPPTPLEQKVGREGSPRSSDRILGQRLHAAKFDSMVLASAPVVRFVYVSVFCTGTVVRFRVAVYNGLLEEQYVWYTNWIIGFPALHCHFWLSKGRRFCAKVRLRGFQACGERGNVGAHVEPLGCSEVAFQNLIVITTATWILASSGDCSSPQSVSSKPTSSSSATATAMGS